MSLIFCLLQSPWIVSCGSLNEHVNVHFHAMLGAKQCPGHITETGSHSYHGKEPGCTPFSRLENLSSFPSVLSLPSHGYLLSSLLKDASKLFSEFKDRVKIGGASAQSFKCPEARDHRRAGYLIRIGEGKTLQQNTNY